MPMIGSKECTPDSKLEAGLRDCVVACGGESDSESDPDMSHIDPSVGVKGSTLDDLGCCGDEPA